MAVAGFSDGELNARIDGLRVGFAGHRQATLLRNRAYLRAFSPGFDSDLQEHDQWSTTVKPEDTDHHRSSYNLTRAVVELWTALEMSEFPAIRWHEEYIPVPAPALDEVENERRQSTYRASKHVARTITTMREQTLQRHIRRTKLARHAFRAVRRKNVYGNAWIKTVPDEARRSFRVFSRIDPSTVYPVYSAWDDERLDAILVATRRSARAVNAEYPGLLPMAKDGLTLEVGATYYQPTHEPVQDADRAFVWTEDYWFVDDEWVGEAGDGGEPLTSRVVNVRRINGRIAEAGEYPGWRNVPYVQFQNENERDQLGFSDVATMLPIQDSINRFMSQQQDVIAGESRPKYKYRGDADRQIILGDEEVISLDPDEDIEQIQVRLDVFPTQIHGQQILEVLARATGLPDTVWGRITAAQNSGRALATAWRSVAARMVPRTQGNATALERLLSMWTDWLELYGWDNARDLYIGNRDFDLDFPNQEPRDFTEVVMAAIQKLQAGLIDTSKAMEETGERSPDEMLDRVRADYMDPIIHPEKSQSWLLLQRLKNQITIEAQQAGMQAQAQAMEMAQMRGTPPGGAPGAGTVDQQAGAASQARVQAAQERAPVQGQGAPAPASGVNSEANSTKVGTLVQDGQTFNRIVTQGEL